MAIVPCAPSIDVVSVKSVEVAAFGKAVAQVRALFARFEMAYAEHSKAEQAVLSKVAQGLSEEQRRLVADLARDL